MKAQIGVRITPLNGYLNLDVAAQAGEKDRVACDPNNLNDLIDHNELSEFLINDLLDYLPIQARSKLLGHYLTKIAHGGKIIIMGNDVYEVSRLVHLGGIDIGQANHVLYGIGRKSFCRPQDNVDIAVGTGQFNVDSIKYNKYQYIITLVRK